MERNIKVVTYNIDGLPEKLDLNKLPCILKPITWVYKLFKKSTTVQINDNQDTDKHITHISKCLKESNADIIGVQEDFNYHTELMSCLKDYKSGKYTGGFDLDRIFSSVECLTKFPKLRFKADGLNTIVKSSRININEEDIVRWKKSYGYVGHANDALTHKGFRFCSITVDNEVDIDVYVLHMDADFYDPVSCPDVSKDIKARRNQLALLVKYITKRYNKGITNPIIIMGDTNCYNKYEWDVQTLNECLLQPVNNIKDLHIEEAIPSKDNDVDRIFYVNNTNCRYKLELQDCYYDCSFNDEIGRVSDHNPFVSTFLIQRNNSEIN